MKLLKHITAFIWLMALLLPLVTPLVLQVQQRYVQWQMEEQLEEKELITLTVEAASVQWIKKGKECLIGNQMFDVKQSGKKENKLILTGLFDEKEKQIKNQLAAHTKQQQKQQQPSKLVKLFLQTAAISASETFSCKTEMPSSAPDAVFKNSCYQSPLVKTTTPPPKHSI